MKRNDNCQDNVSPYVNSVFDFGVACSGILKKEVYENNARAMAFVV